MLWFEGSVAEAVNLSKQRNAIFVVFVEGDNDLSSEMARTLEDGDITRRLVEQTNFLTIKLKSGSTDYVHFAQIYQFVPVPSLFFIGRNGTPLEVVCAGIQATSLATRIDRILEEHHKQSPSVSSAAVASGSKDNVKQTTADLIKSEASTSEASASVPAEKAPSTAAAAPTPPPSGDPKPQYEVVCDGDVCARRPLDRDEAGPSQPANPPPNLTPVLQPSAESIALVNQQEQAKMERAKLLIEARKREKAELEKQQEIQKELERRQVGQGVAELKKWQQDQEMKQIQEERRREKKENDMARQRVLDQIAQDRAERRARDLPPAPAPAPAPATPVTPTAPLDLGNKARIQFKMPDGSSATAQFDAGDTLATVRRHVADNLHLTSSSFTLWTAFPRLELRDDSATLTQLKLAPSAALLVLPSSAVAKPNTSSRIASFTTFLIQILTSLVIEPTTLVYNWVRARLFPPPPANPRRPTPPPASSAPGLRYRHRTNVHRLNGDADDDENNTWNGNSTQQM